MSSVVERKFLSWVESNVQGRGRFRKVRTIRITCHWKTDYFLSSNRNNPTKTRSQDFNRGSQTNSVGRPLLYESSKALLQSAFGIALGDFVLNFQTGERFLLSKAL